MLFLDSAHQNCPKSAERT